MAEKVSQFDALATPVANDYIIVLDSSDGEIKKVLRSDSMVATSDITMLNGKSFQTGTTAADVAYISGYDTDGSVYTPIQAFYAGTSPYGIMNTNMFIVAGATLAAPTGYINGSLTAVGNVGTGEDDLQSYTIPAAQLNTTGRGVRVTFWGYTANNANAKTVKIYVGGTAVGTLALGTGAVDVWMGYVEIIRTGSDTQIVNGEIKKQGGATLTIYNTALNLTEANTIIVKTTGTATADNDIVSGRYRVEHI